MVPGSTFSSPVSSFADDWMESNGDWFVRGSNVDGQAWLLRNGVVIAASGQPITPGSTELWTTAFRDVKGDNRGNYVISGHTNNADTTHDDVLVLNGTRVIARESDPVDLNGNGLADDDMFLGVMVADRSAFNNDGYYYFGPRVKNGAGTTNSSSTFLRVQAIALHCNPDFNGDGDTGTDSDIEAFFACLAGNCCSYVRLGRLQQRRRHRHRFGHRELLPGPRRRLLLSRPLACASHLKPRRTRRDTEEDRELDQVRSTPLPFSVFLPVFRGSICWTMKLVSQIRYNLYAVSPWRSPCISAALSSSCVRFSWP